MTATISLSVRAALEAVDEDVYTRTPDGERVRQSSAPAIIAAILDLLDVQPGQRVLEIGTGSGYSTALLSHLVVSHLVGASGHVTTIDIDPALTRRAAGLLAATGHRNVEPVCGDGRQGTPGRPTLYDRVIAWTTPDPIPEAWIQQTTPQAVIVTPVNLAGIAKAFAVVRLHREGKDGVVADQLIPGGFVEADDTVLTQWEIPPYGVDVQRQIEGRPWWLSTAWLRTTPKAATVGNSLLDQLINNGHWIPGPLHEEDDPDSFHAWLLATRPPGLTTAACGDPVWRIGYSSPTGIMLITTEDGRRALHAGDEAAVQQMFAWAKEWHDQGRPGWRNLRPEAVREGDTWRVRARLRS